MNPAITILYFGALAEQLGRREEKLDVPHGVSTIGHLRDYLMSRGWPWHALSATTLRVAANQTIVADDYALDGGDEIAFFPPVTGG